MVFAFLKTCYSLQSVTSERRFGCVNMVRSQVKQFNIFGLTGKYFKVGDCVIGIMRFLREIKDFVLVPRDCPEGGGSPPRDNPAVPKQSL